MHLHVAIRTHLPPTFQCAPRTCLTTADHEFRNQQDRLFQPTCFTSRVSSLILFHPSAVGILTCRMFPFYLANSTVLIPHQGRWREPFSTPNSQATLGRHNNLTGQFICSLMDIFCHQYSLTTCRFIFVLHATHMSQDDLFFKNLLPMPKSSIQKTTSLTTSARLATHQSSTAT